MKNNDLPIIQKTYDLIKWYVPILGRLPRDHKQYRDARHRVSTKILVQRFRD